ncbi:unnamed protein product [Pelagomonas calceolata]|uniref:GRF-type domain-containing protein n=1 Tax=Pelagomonas calceolata TaxID=35677 RepID=A0A8J2S734_9STRA|nr:unnamed protein product [Pelagomonas calceolata]
MVEGPGATKNARNARKLVGCRLASIEGIDSVPVGARLAEVLCLGKEVWLIFASEAAAATGDDSDDVVDLCGGSDDDSVIDLCGSDDAPTPPPKQEHAVRVHFGMSGSLKVDAKTPGYGARALRCAFDGGRTLDVFNVGEYGGVHAARDVEKVREKVFTRTSLDVCSEAFDPAAAAARLARETSTVAVAVMNQGVSPGTGNIIKNEALHRARVAPDRKVGDLSEDEVKAVVRELRSYARAWLQGRRPPFLVYDKAACGDCGGTVSVSKGAATAGRVTFHCAACCAQTTSPRPQKRNAFDVLAQPPPKRPRTEPAPVRMRGHSCKKPLEKVKRVKKTNENEGRLFWSCGRRDCKAEFKWADESFPKCGCKKTSILRICKKTGPNAGRWFHACGQRKCSFFEWATREKLDAALGDQLRPLL